MIYSITTGIITELLPTTILLLGLLPPSAPFIDPEETANMTEIGIMMELLNIPMTANTLTRLKRGFFSDLVDCDAAMPRKIVQTCTFAMIDKLAQEEKIGLDLLNATIATLSAEISTELQIHHIVLQILKISATAKTQPLLWKLESSLANYSAELNNTQETLRALNKLENQVNTEAATPLLVSDFLVDNVSKIALAALCGTCLSLALNLFLICKVFRLAIPTIGNDNHRSTSVEIPLIHNRASIFRQRTP